MAMFDDRSFLLSHIRHSFITCDDSGVCEMALLNEIIPHHLPSEPDKEFLDSLYVDAKSELERAQSLDILSDMDMIGAHRRRSNTAQRLERLKKERKNQAKVKVVQWKDNCPQNSMSKEEYEEMFPVKDPTKRSSQEKTKKSALTSQIDMHPSLPNNPFSDYSRFDGRMNEGSPVKRMSIFLTMLPPEEVTTPIEVVVVASARVQDLIGLICWQYTNEGKEPRLKELCRYSLRIAEENGDVDPDFPSLNPKDPVAKFGFPFLALVEKEEDELNACLVVTVHIDEMFSKLEAPNLQVPLKWVLEQTLKKRKTTSSNESDSQFTLEAVREPGIALDLNQTLCEIETREFKLVKGRVKRGLFDELDSDGGGGGDTPSRHNAAVGTGVPDMFAIEAPLFKEFTVRAVNRFHREVGVCLGVSGQKVDVNPFPGSRSSHGLLAWQPKTTSIPVENIADCFVTRANADKTRFKIVYKTSADFDSLKFVGDTRIVEEIVRKIKFVMKMRNGSVRDEYKNRNQSRKPTRYHSFTYGFRV